jgi:hypothetical protein
MTPSQNWFPGQDYPDRDIWLEYRAPRISTKARLIWDSSKGPMKLGINAAKRAARTADKMATALRQNGAPRCVSNHQALVEARHGYYAKRAEAA